MFVTVLVSMSIGFDSFHVGRFNLMFRASRCSSKFKSSSLQKDQISQNINENQNESFERQRTKLDLKNKTKMII